MAQLILRQRGAALTTARQQDHQVPVGFFALRFDRQQPIGIVDARRVFFTLQVLDDQHENIV